MLRLLSPQMFERLTVAGLIISCVLNFLALPLAIRSTRHILGTYKIIMLLFSTTNTLFYIPLLLRPVHYFRRYMIVVYVDGSEDWIKDIATDLSIKFFAVIFMITIFLEALHFVYRYLLLCRFKSAPCSRILVFRIKYHGLLTADNLKKFLFTAYPSYIMFHFLNFSLFTPMDEDTCYAAGFLGRHIHAIAYLFVVGAIIMGLCFRTIKLNRYDGRAWLRV